MPRVASAERWNECDGRVANRPRNVPGDVRCADSRAIPAKLTTKPINFAYTSQIYKRNAPTYKLMCLLDLRNTQFLSYDA